MQKKLTLLLSFAAGVLVGTLVSHLPRLLTLPPDSPETLLERLQTAGLAYEGTWIDSPNPGFYLKRKGDSRTWEELSSSIARIPAKMPGWVVVLDPKGDGRPNEIEGPRIGNLHLIGDPAMVQEILAALRR